MSDLTNLYVSEFYGLGVICVTSESLGTLILAKPLSDSLGLDWESQRERINRSPVFNPVILNGSDMLHCISSSHRTQYVNTKIRPGSRYLCIPESEVGVWICSIVDAKTRKDIREGVRTYKSDIGKDLYIS